jgi:Flp pilus assembly protein TadG
MLICSRDNQTKRRGAHSLEFAVIAPIIFMLIFGIFEYCRLLAVKHLAENAVREASRVGAARTNDFDTKDVAEVVEKYMMTFAAMLKNPKIEVYCAKPETKEPWAGTYAEGNPTTIPKAPFYNAGFRLGVAVHYEGIYTPVLPNLLLMNSEIKISATSIMLSEAN